MELTTGQPRTVIGLLDGPIAGDHRALVGQSIRWIGGRDHSACAQPASLACIHGTFVAGMLVAQRGAEAPAICPGCTLLVRPIFREVLQAQQLPSVPPEELASAIWDCVSAGAQVLNLSVGFAQASMHGERVLQDALDFAARRGTIVVVAAGNQGTIGSSAITRHPWVIPVAACDELGRPIGESNLGSSIGRRGLSAPGRGVTSLHSRGDYLTLSGTSVAAPFVTGTVALLWSLFAEATATDIRLAVTRAFAGRRRTIVPPLLDAWAAYQFMRDSFVGRG